MGFRLVGSVRDDLGGGLAGDGEVQFVLNRGEEVAGVPNRGGIVDGRGVDVGDLLVRHPLAGADIPNLFEQFVEKASAEP